MGAPLYLTKGELRAKLLTRLGYGGLGAAAGMFVPIADDLLEEAQEQLFQIFTDEKGVREWEIPTGVNQRWYDIPLTCDVDRIMGMWAQQNGDYWHPLIRGIGPAHDSDYDDIDDYPYRYDIRVNGDVLSGEKQVNGGLSTADATEFGGSNGFTWGSFSSEISGGKLQSLAAAAPHVVISTTPVAVGAAYEIEYTISGRAVLAVALGGAVTDDAGSPLGVNVGTHKHTVTATSLPSLSFVFDAAPGIGVDDVSIKEVLGSSKTQIEIWPKPDDVYLMKIEGPMVVAPFVADGDRASFDSRLILLYAVAFGKAHLNKPDAKSAMDAWTTRLNRIKANQHGTRKYVRKNPGTPEIEIRSRPKVV